MSNHLLDAAIKLAEAFKAENEKLKHELEITNAQKIDLVLACSDFVNATNDLAEAAHSFIADPWPETVKKLKEACIKYEKEKNKSKTE